MPDPVAAAKSVVTVPVAAVKAHPIVWVVVLGALVLVAIRYRATIVGWLTKAPGGARVTTFTRTA